MLINCKSYAKNNVSIFLCLDYENQDEVIPVVIQYPHERIIVVNS